MKILLEGVSKSDNVAMIVMVVAILVILVVYGQIRLRKRQKAVEAGANPATYDSVKKFRDWLQACALLSLTTFMLVPMGRDRFFLEDFFDIYSDLGILEYGDGSATAVFIFANVFLVAAVVNLALAFMRTAKRTVYVVFAGVMAFSLVVMLGIFSFAALNMLAALAATAAQVVLLYKHKGSEAAFAQQQ